MPGAGESVAPVDTEVGVALGDGQHHALVALQLEVFGEQRDVVVLRGDFARGRVGMRVIDQMLLHRVGEVAERRGLAVDRVGQVSAEALVECGDELDALQRIQAERCDRGFGRDVRETGARHRERVLADGGERGGRREGAAGAGIEASRCQCGVGRAVSTHRQGTRHGWRGAGPCRSMSWRSCRNGSARRRRARGRARRAPRRGRRRGPAPNRRCRRARPRARGRGAVRRLRRRRTPPRGRLRAAGGFAGGGFDVLRVVVEAADDDEVVDSARDVELRLRGRSPGRRCAERDPRRCRFAARGTSRRFCSDRASSPGRRIRRRPRSRRRGSDATGRQCVWRRRWRRQASRRARRSRRVRRAFGALSGSGSTRFLRERVVVECAHRGAVPGLRPGDHQRRLRQAIARIERRGLEPARREGLGEARERLGLDRLGPDEGDGPRGEIERRALLRTDLAHAEVVGEVRPAGDRRAGFADRVEPEKGILEERCRRHDDVGDAGVDGREDAADEPHVVVGGKPEDACVSSPIVEGLADGARVRDEIGVAQHHAFRLAGGARGVLDHRE